MGAGAVVVTVCVWVVVMVTGTVTGWSAAGVLVPLSLDVAPIAIPMTSATAAMNHRLFHQDPFFSYAELPGSGAARGGRQPGGGPDAEITPPARF